MAVVENPKLVLVHGSWHRPQHMDPWARELERNGYETIVPDIPIDTPGLTFDDYAQALAADLEGERDLVAFFHSRAANIGPRVVDLMPKGTFRHMGFIAGSFENSTSLGFGMTQPPDVALTRNTPESRRHVLDMSPDHGGYMTRFEAVHAKHFFYHDVPYDTAVSAINWLRPQYRPPENTQPALTDWPDISQSYAIPTDDRVINVDWMYGAAQYLGLDPVVMSGGHSPHLADPGRMAGYAIDIVENL